MTADWRDLLANPDQVNIEYLKRAPDGGNWHVGSPYSRRQMVAAGHEIERLRAALASPRADSDERTADVSVDVQAMRASNGTDYYVRITCDGREVTPHCFKERWKAEYEAAHYAWIFGLRVDEPSILAFDPESHPNTPASPDGGQAVAARAKAHHDMQFYMDGSVDGLARVPRQRLAEWLGALASATPAQPAGAVPDSLRALSEDYARKLDARRVATGAYNAAYDAILKMGRDPKPEELRAERSASSHAEEALTVATIALLGACLDFATHPAGQSAGSGAGNREHHLEEQLREGLAFIEMEAEAQEPGSDLYTWVKVTEQLLSERSPAPDSTRTGQGEADQVEAVARAIFEADEDLNDRTVYEMRLAGKHVAADALAGPRARWDDPKNAPILDAFRYRAKKAIEAARPAAPEAQGAWSFDMEAAPQDGTRVLLWMQGCWIHPVIGYRAPSTPGSQRDCWREHGSRARIHRVDCWQPIPAPPASSGQGGR